MTESITPRQSQTPEIKYQPSMLSLRSAAATVPPEAQSPIGAQPAQKPATRRKLWFFAALSAIAVVVGASALPSRAHVSADVRSGSPGFKKSPQGKLRLLYEANPFSFIFEAAGGKASDGKRRILYIPATAFSTFSRTGRRLWPIWMWQPQREVR